MHKVVVGSREIAPSKIVCVGRNYHAHIEELNNEIPARMVLFLKPNSAISKQLTANHQEPLHYEGELCYLVEQGRLSAVGFGFDLTKRALQTKLKAKGLPWERAKAFDGSAVFSRFIEISEVADSTSFELTKNGALVQMGDIRLMIHKPQEILFDAQTFLSLEDGDILMTGTPRGVGVIAKDDVFSVSVKVNDKEILRQSWVAT